MTARISCHGVTIHLGGQLIVSDVAIDVAPGGWVSIVGPNGAGKTTLLRAVAGLVAYDGTIAVGGDSMTALSARARARVVAVVPQDPIVPYGLKVLDYVLLGRTSHIGRFGVEGVRDLAVARDVLQQLELSPLAQRRIETLSGGERQRTVLARALAQEAPVLLLDEPTTALDIGHQQEVLDLVDELRRDRGLTVLSTMHDLTLAAQYAESLVLLDRGVVVTSGSPDDVLTEDNLSRYYGARVRVVRDEGTIVIVPLRSSVEANELHRHGVVLDDVHPDVNAEARSGRNR
ncbi:MAG: cobalamin transport system ATP-binding protein [Acidimicrobiaceae bacterium]|jgi:iron complex transport system ATP-binding protein